MIKSPFTFLLVLITLLAACSKKPVQLPLIDSPGLSEIYNHSSIWIFMEIYEGDTTAVLNKNNKITNTDWIFNTDKRLQMDDVVPILIEMQENRNKDSMHKKEGMENYFSYANPSSEKICLFPFTRTIYRDTPSNAVISDCLEHLRVTKNGFVFHQKEYARESLEVLAKKLDTCANGQMKKISLIIDENITFQDYLYTRVKLSEMGISCDREEYMHSVK